MSLKTEAIALAVRIVVEKTNLVSRPDQVTEFWNQLFGIEPYDVKIARRLESSIDNAADKAKQKIHERAEKRRTIYPFKK